VLSDSTRVKLQSWTIASFTIIQLCDCYIGRRIQSNVQLTLTAYKTGNRTSQTRIGQSGLDRRQGWNFLLCHRNHITQPTSSSYLGSSHVCDASTAWSSLLFNLYSRGKNTRHYTSEPPHISLEWFLNKFWHDFTISVTMGYIPV